MPTHKTTGRIVGILYVLGTAAGALSLAALPTVGDAPDVLRAVGEGTVRVGLGASLIVAMGLALAFIPLVAYPVLRRENEPLAVGYVVFRGGLETATYLLLAHMWLVLAPLGRQYVDGDGPAGGQLTSGAVILESYEVMAHIGLTIVFALGALLFSYVLFRARLVPRWLSGWGVVAALLLVPAAGLAAFGLIERGSAGQTIANIPIAVQEMVLAGWLIVKGFNPPDKEPVLASSGREAERP